MESQRTEVWGCDTFSDILQLEGFRKNDNVTYPSNSKGFREGFYCILVNPVSALGFSQKLASKEPFSAAFSLHNLAKPKESWKDKWQNKRNMTTLAG